METVLTMNPPQDVLDMMPIGYMIIFSGEQVPNNFIEVSGQPLSKNEHLLLFSVLVGTVIDCGSFFVLPTRETLLKLFGAEDTSDKKIILKIM